MKLKARHYRALEAARWGPIRRVAMGRHADTECGEFNYSTVETLRRCGLVWENQGMWWLTRSGKVALHKTR